MCVWCVCEVYVCRVCVCVCEVCVCVHTVHGENRVCVEREPVWACARGLQAL